MAQVFFEMYQNNVGVKGLSLRAQSRSVLTSFAVVLPIGTLELTDNCVILIHHFKNKKNHRISVVFCDPDWIRTNGLPDLTSGCSILSMHCSEAKLFLNKKKPPGFGGFL
jgi:hypothetical protein